MSDIFFFLPFSDMNTLLLRSQKFPMANKVVLSLSPLQPTSTVIVSNLPQGTQDITVLCHFERFAGVHSVNNVKLLPGNKALVFFVNYKSELKTF